MIRLLGILSGAAVAIAILILIIGVPEFVRDVDPEIDPIVSEPIDPIVSEPIDPIVSEPINPIVSEPVAVTVDDVPGAVEEAVVVQADVTASTAIEITDNATTEAQKRSAEPIVETVDSTRDAQQWYAFWSPFRSQIAASGFVAQLQRVTGLDYRIVNIKPGVYEVAFAYADDNEIQTNLSQISVATGLDMPES